MEKKLNEVNMNEIKNIKEVKDISYEELRGVSEKLEDDTTRPSSMAEMFSKELHRIDNKGKRIETMEDLTDEIEKYNKNMQSDFTNVNWSKIVKDKEFTEEYMTMFQVQAQNYYEDFIKLHKVSDEFIRKMYYDFIGVFMLEWLPLKDRQRVFPEVFEEK